MKVTLVFAYYTPLPEGYYARETVLKSKEVELPFVPQIGMLVSYPDVAGEVMSLEWNGKEEKLGCAVRIIESKGGSGG